ncbi:MAG: HAD-IIB family hydrolase [Acidobacteria bacterium]|nr:HAD-IIB family hydrolase [Acidobacteriota bacterium]
MVVFSDLDGTLLDRDTYSFAQAKPAMTHLRARKIPLVLVTSKTRAEVTALREEMGNTDPYIVENGAAVVIPGGADIVMGSTAAAAREALRKASEASGVRVRGFREMPLGEIRARTGLEAKVAELASRREFGEPFVVLEGDVSLLDAALRAQGFRMTRGGRFFHVLGGCDKGKAALALAAFLNDEDTLGLGDAPNDVVFLREMRRAVIIPSPHLEAMRAALPDAAVAPEAGPAGWNQAVLDLVVD